MYPTPGRAVMVYMGSTGSHYPGVIVDVETNPETEPPSCFIQVFGMVHPIVKNDKGNVYVAMEESDGTVPDTWYWPPRADDHTNTRYSYHGSLHYLDQTSGKMVPCYEHRLLDGSIVCRPSYEYDTDGKKVEMSRPERRDL